jgi:signal transduction histidine kinase
MRQVIENLLSNAVKFTPRGGSVAVALRAEAEGGERRLHLCVRDTGPGIARREQGRLFKKFVRLAGTKAEGTGLGLYVCKTIVEAHKGRIWVESSAGQGSAFHVSLPCA